MSLLSCRESRDGSRLKSVSAFAPFRHLGSVTVAQTEPTRSALTDTPCTQKVLWVLTTGCPGLCPSVHPPASSAPWGFPNQGSAPLMWGLPTVTWPRVWSCCHLATSVGSRDLRTHCGSPPFAVPAALPCRFPNPSSLSPRLPCRLPQAHSSPSRQPGTSGSAAGPADPQRGCCQMPGTTETGNGFHLRRRVPASC